ncbi:hypothetical protein EVAR_58215_1 [Eumeta japonica]|uniref:Uncharacterized protein n=1 Tax=Eumeta variegata TaxID=151549 RepID=A0A4C1ZSG9_EUMVA|nr:hypothetical protein EVAR_58215_1 [Eumeta japonica]
MKPEGDHWNYVTEHGNPNDIGLVPFALKRAPVLNDLQGPDSENVRWSQEICNETTQHTACRPLQLMTQTSRLSRSLLSTQTAFTLTHTYAIRSIGEFYYKLTFHWRRFYFCVSFRFLHSDLGSLSDALSCPTGAAFGTRRRCVHMSEDIIIIVIFALPVLSKSVPSHSLFSSNRGTWISSDHAGPLRVVTVNVRVATHVVRDRRLNRALRGTELGGSFRRNLRNDQSIGSWSRNRRATPPPSLLIILVEWGFKDHIVYRLTKNSARYVSPGDANTRTRANIEAAPHWRAQSDATATLMSNVSQSIRSAAAAVH